MSTWLLLTLLLSGPLDEARQFASQGKHAQAVVKFDAAIAVDAKSSEAHAGKAVSLLALRRYDDALESIERAVSLKPDEPGYEMIAGRALIAKNQIEPARQRYERAAKIAATKAGMIHADLAAALSAKNDPKLARDIEAALKNATEADPPHLDSLFHLGQTHVAAGKPEGRAYLSRYLDASMKLPETQRNARKIQLAKQMIRAADIANSTR